MAESSAQDASRKRVSSGVVGAALLCFLLPLAVYLPTPGDYWVRYDNESLIRKEPIVRTLARPVAEIGPELARMFTTAHGDLYQPLLSFSLAVDYKLFGWDRAGYHAHSLLLHMIITVLVFALAYRLIGVVWASFFAAALVGAHPAAVETVSWIIHRTILVTAFWILIGSHAYLTYLRDPRRTGWLVAATAAFGLSCMAKVLPSVVLMPLAFDLWQRRSPSARMWLEKLPLLAIACFFTGLSFSFSSARANGGEAATEIATAISNGVAGLGLSIANVIVPVKLALFYPADATWSILGGRAPIAALAVAAVVGVGVVLWRRGERGLLLSTAMGLAVLGPFIAAASLFRDVATADRYSYIALLVFTPGIAQVLALAGRSASAGRKSAVVLLVLLSAWGLACAAVARTQAREWGNEEALWRASLANAKHPVAFGALGNVYLQNNDWEASVGAYREAVDLVEGRYESERAPAYYQNAARIALLAADQLPDVDGARVRYLDEAIEFARRGESIWPDNAKFAHDLGRAYHRRGDLDESIRAFERAVEVSPARTNAWFALGEAYESRGDLGLAAKAYYWSMIGRLASRDAPQRFVSLAERGLQSPERKEVRRWAEQYVDRHSDAPGAASLREQLRISEESLAEASFAVTSAGNGWNVVLVVVDTLRADHVGSYGYGRETTPHFDRLAESSLLFTNAIAQAPWTRPATASILTGLHPKNHRAITRSHRLPSEIATLAEILRAAEYETAAFVANGNVFPSSGFSQGFDLFRMLPRPANPDSDYVTAKADDVNREALAHLAALDRRNRQFVYLHYVDPHDPYIPNEVHFSQNNQLRFTRQFLEDEFDTLEGEARASALREMINAYDDEVRFVDSRVGELIDRLREYEMLENSVVIVVSDHGEEFLEHGELSHGKSLYQEMIRVPLLIRLPGVAPRRVEQQVSQVDILPMLLAALSIEAEVEFDGVNFLAENGADALGFSELELDGRKAQAVLTPTRKLIRNQTDQGESYAYFDLRADPGEQQGEPIESADERAPSAEMLKSALLEFFSQRGDQRDDTGIVYERETAEQLKALGYIDSVDSSPDRGDSTE